MPFSIYTDNKLKILASFIFILGFAYSMELKPSSIATLLAVLLLLDITPCFSRGKLKLEALDKEIYEIDYRGPETHTYIPPPNGSRERPKIHHQTSMMHRKTKGSRVGRKKGNGRKIRG